MGFNSLFDLTGKTAIVTGGARGLGQAMAIGLAQAGADVVVADLLDEEAAKTVEEVRKLSRKSMSLRVDVTNSKDVEAMINSVVKEFGKLDIIINSAGITKRMPALDFIEEDFDRVIAVNLKGVFLSCQAAGRQMVKQGGGKIINMASVGGLVGLRNTVAYCASKGGVVQITKTLALEWAPYNIKVNAIAPCLFETSIAAPVFASKETYEAFVSKIPLGRIGKPADLVGTAIFLASPASDMMTGHILAVDGGWLAE